MLQGFSEFSGQRERLSLAAIRNLLYGGDPHDMSFVAVDYPDFYDGSLIC